jgi:hypothetical protein
MMDAVLQVPRCRGAVRTADHSSLSLRRSSACRRSLGCNACVVHVVPSSIPRQTSRMATSTSMVTVLCGASRHDVSLPGHGLPVGLRGSVSRSAPHGYHVLPPCP